MQTKEYCYKKRIYSSKKDKLVWYVQKEVDVVTVGSQVKTTQSIVDQVTSRVQQMENEEPQFKGF